MFDPQVPKALLERQKWFAKTITLPLKNDDRLPKESSSGANLENEAEKYIEPSVDLTSHQRIEIYHQQYWWRLLKVLQQNFPAFNRFVGPSAFREISIAYLSQFPPNHYSLCKLGETLPEWILKEYSGEEKKKLYQMAQIDFAAQKAFWSKAYPLPTPIPEPSVLLTLPVCLQPFLSLFSLSSDLFSFRDQLLKNDCPQVAKDLKLRDCYFVVYRTPQNFSSWKEISYGEYRLLNLIQKNGTILKSCQTLEDEPDAATEEASVLAPLWFKEWISLGWLAFI